MAPLAEVQLDGPDGEVSNGARTILPLRFFAAARGGSGRRPLASGPLHSQQHRFTCRPTDPAFEDFFDFEAWTWASPDATPGLGEDGTLLEAACLLLPKEPSMRRWASAAAPKVLEVEAVAATDRQRPTDGADGLTVRATYRQRFAPQLVVLEAQGPPAALKHGGANLTMLL